MGKITLVTGGARSGKSDFALHRALEGYKKRVFVATANAFDDEMKRRIAAHREQRKDLFTTIEEPVKLRDALLSISGDVEVVLVDCLTVWLGNIYYHNEDEETRVRNGIDEFCASLGSVVPDLYLVTNEVGWGIVPENALARSYRDMAGYLNRQVASRADEVYLVSCGLPLQLKGK